MNGVVSGSPARTCCCFRVSSVKASMDICYSLVAHIHFLKEETAAQRGEDVLQLAQQENGGLV